MCKPSAPKAPASEAKADPLRILLSRDKFKGSTGGPSNYLLPARTAGASSPGASLSSGLNLVK